MAHQKCASTKPLVSPLSSARMQTVRTLINPPKGGDALKSVDFSKSPSEIAKALADNAENLEVLFGNKESDGSPCYTLVDKGNFAPDIDVDIKF